MQDPKGIVYVATELCPLGSLKTYLQKNRSHVSKEDDDSTVSESPKLTCMDLVRWSNEIASGMEYLSSKHVIHADLASRNVLLAEDKTAKITDFGLSRKLYDYTNYVKKQQQPLPWRWMAIESLKDLEFSEKSDVWSYGVTLWEIFSLGAIPYPGLSWNLSFMDRLENGLRMNLPPYATLEIYEVMQSC